MQVILLAILLLLSGCKCASNVKVNSKPEQYVPALDDVVKLTDPFYKNCSFRVKGRDATTGRYILRGRCGYENIDGSAVASDMVPE